MDNDADPVLCYVSGNTAYFTRRALSEQSGDDWNDAPYEHNAERPYDPDGSSIVRVWFESELAEPLDGLANAPFSVNDINAGQIAWLRSLPGCPEPVAIAAGTPLSEFMRVMKRLFCRAVVLDGAEPPGPGGDGSAFEFKGVFNDQPSPDGGYVGMTEIPELLAAGWQIVNVHPAHGRIGWQFILQRRAAATAEQERSG